MRYSKTVLAIIFSLIIQLGCGGDDKKMPTQAETAKQPDPFLGCQKVTAIQAGSTVTGALATSDCLINNTIVDFYELSLSASRAVTIDLMSTAFDAVLLLADRKTGAIISDDDDGGEETNSRIIIVLSPGTYIIAATTLDNIGAYTLSVK